MLKILTEKGKKATCKIISKNKNGDIIFGSGIFCKIQYFNKKIKVLLTNNHILNEDSIKKGNKIEFVYEEYNKIIEINNKRFCKSSPIYDFTCIEILDEDNIEDFYEIEEINKDYNYKERPIAIVQYPGEGKMEIKTGHLVEIINYIIRYKVSTENGSYGSPIILLSNYKIIGIHQSYDEEKDLNIGIYIENIIQCINKNEILFKFNIRENDLNKEIQILNYNNSIDNSNQKALENCCQIYLNNEKIDFHFTYKFNKEGEYIFNIKFNNSILKNISCLFSNCTTLIEIDFSNFNTINIKDMNSMFSNCSSLKNLDLKNFKTDNLEDMYSMFSDCSSLIEINLSSFDTKNVHDMSYMFSKCSSLINLDLSNFDTRNVTDMSYMFAECYSLSNLNLINFNVEKVNDMSYMFQDCKSLNVLDLSNFKTNKNNCIYKIFNGLSLKCSIITKDKRLLYKRKTYLY